MNRRASPGPSYTTPRDATRLSLGVRRIATEVGRNPSTISRELRRHRCGHDRNYDGDRPHARAREAAQRPRGNRLSRDEELRQVVQAKLDRGEPGGHPVQEPVGLRVPSPDIYAVARGHRLII